MYMHYSPKKLLMTLTCIDIYACNIVSRTKSTGTFQNYCIYLSNLLLITQIFIENSEDKRQKTKDKVFKEYWNLGTQKRHQKELT